MSYVFTTKSSWLCKGLPSLTAHSCSPLRYSHKPNKPLPEPLIFHFSVRFFHFQIYFRKKQFTIDSYFSFCDSNGTASRFYFLYSDDFSSTLKWSFSWLYWYCLLNIYTSTYLLDFAEATLTHRVSLTALCRTTVQIAMVIRLSLILLFFHCTIFHFYSSFNSFENDCLNFNCEKCPFLSIQLKLYKRKLVFVLKLRLHDSFEEKKEIYAILH